jgi:hypothetical protein
MGDRSASTKRLRVGALIVATAIAPAGCGSTSKRPASASTTVAPTSTLTLVNPASSTAQPTTATSTTDTTALVGHSVPVSVQADAAMRAAGNDGPSSSILVPSSCTVTSTSATASGTYRGGLAPEIYHRYGDVVDLYVFSSPAPGYADGIQLATPFTRNSHPSAAAIHGQSLSRLTSRSASHLGAR